MKSTQIITLSLVFILGFSSVSSSYADLILQNQKPDAVPSGIPETSSITKLTKDFTISLEERKIQSTNQEITVTLIKLPVTQYVSRVQISEGITVTNGGGSENQIYLFKYNPTQAIIDRIFNSRKYKFDKAVGLPLSSDSLVSLYNDLVGSPTVSIADITAEDFDQISVAIENIFGDKFSDLELQQINTALSFNLVYDDLEKQAGLLGDSILKQSVKIIFILANAAFYIIVRSENPKIKVQNYKRILSLIFICILISSAVMTPLSISKSYYAYAETMDSNSTAPEPPSTGMTETDESGTLIPLSSIINETSTEQIAQTNSTQNESNDTTNLPYITATQDDSIQALTNTKNNTAVPTNSTMPQANSTQTTPSNPIQTIQSLIESLSMTGNTAVPTNSTMPQANSTQTTPSNPIQTIQSLIESLSMTGNTAVPTNSTMPQISIPNATKSWGANATSDSELIGNVFVNQTGIRLDGGFLKAGGNFTNQTSSLSVAAWVKPDYDSGASIFTILSKDKSFELTLNNILAPKHTATFSVFDGIKWHQVQTRTELGQGWSHVAGTFNGTNISIYINGTLSNTLKTIPTSTVDSKGDIQSSTPQISSKDSDIAVGATLDSRAVDSATRAFTGSLDEIKIYDQYLTGDQILALYQKTLPLILTKLIPIEQIQEIEQPPVILLNQTNVNGTLKTNSTEYVVVPKINQTSQITISAWVAPEYNKLTDVLTVVSKDRSFALSLNNFIDPAHTATFSVFDGIHWTDIQGTSKIESKSHLAAVINGTHIMLYVNGTLQDTQTLQSSFSVSEGELVATSSAVTNSETDVVIGAYISTLRKGKDAQLSNKFSGTINDAIIYNRALDATEIKQLYTSQITDTPRPLVPLFSENILSFTDIVTLTYIPKEIIATNQTTSEDSLALSDIVDLTFYNSNMNVISAQSEEEVLGLSDNIKLIQSLAESNTTKTTDNLAISDILEVQKSTYTNGTKAADLLGLSDTIYLQKSAQQVQDDSIIYEERGKDYYKVEYENGTGQVTFGLPEWMLDPATDKYVEHIVTETNNEITYDSMQIPFVFDKNDCSVSIYEKGKIGANSPPVVGKKHWKLMEDRNGNDQWSESPINNDTCNVESFENSTGFFINAIKENKDGKFITTYGKKIDQPLESFLYYTNTANNTNTKFGFVEQLDNINSDEADLGDQTVTSKPDVAQKFVGTKQKLLNKLINGLADLDTPTIKELKQNEKLSKKKADLVSDRISFNKEHSDSLIFDFSKATKEFSNMNIENKNGKLKTTVEFLNVTKALKKGETIFLDPTVVFSSGTFREVLAQGSGTTCQTPSNINGPSAAEASVTRQSSNTGCARTSREFDISSIDSRAVITDVTTSFTTNAFGGTRTCEIRPIQFQPTAYSVGGTKASPNPDATQLWNDIGNGTAYATSITCAAASGGPIDLGSSGDSDVQAAIDVGQTWFALGYKLEDESRPVSGGLIGSRFDGITLTVKYDFKSKLSEKIGITDAVKINKIVTNPITNNLGITDTLTITKSKLQNLSEKLGFQDTIKTIPKIVLSERLGLSDAATAKKTKIVPTEKLGITDTIHLSRTAGVQQLSEKLGISDSAFAAKVFTKSLSENLGLSMSIKTIKNKFLTEKLGITDAVVAQRFPGVEFNTQNGCTVISAGSATKTLTAGVDYTAPQGEAFIRIVDTRQQGIGRTSGGGSQNADDVTAYLSDPDFAGGSVTFTRAGTTNNDRVCWQIVDYQGLPTNQNAIKVLRVGSVTYTGTGLTVDTPTISGVTNDNKVAVFITGQGNVDTARGDWNTALSTAEWISTSDIARFTREDAGSDANSLSYVIVEFTGSNWSVQRIPHTYSSTNAETENITDVGSTSRAFFQYQHRSTDGGLDEVGSDVYFSSTNQITFDLHNSASIGGLTVIAGVAWVVSNSQIGNDAMIVEHKSGTRSGGATEEYTENIPINNVRSLSTTSIMGETAESSGTGTIFPVGSIAFNLTATNNVVLITSDTANAQNYRLQIVQWPTKPAKTHQISLTENLGIKDTVTAKTTKVTLSENLGIKDTVTAKTTKVTLSENLGIKDTVTTISARTLSITENLGLTDNTSPTTSKTKSLTENLGIVDTATNTVTRTQSITENLGIMDQVISTASKIQSLTESLGMNDTTSARTSTITLTESLGMNDTATARTSTVSLTESLGMNDTATARTSTVSLTESLGMNDTTSARTSTITLTESLGMNDTATARTSTVSLTESLGMNDTATARTSTVSLTESLGMNDTTSARTSTVSLTESLGMNDTTIKSSTKKLTENLGLADTISSKSSNTQSLTENLGFKDNVASTPTKSLTEKLGISDKNSFKGGIRITAKDISDALVGGATYTINPNPYGGASLTVVDGGLNDKDSIVGKVTVGPVPFGTYNVTMTTIPTGYNVMGNSTLYEAHYTQLNGTLMFRLASTTTNLATIPPTVITSAPSLNDTTFNTWKDTYSATIVNGSTTYSISTVSDLPPIISVGNQTNLLDTAVARQGSVKLNLSFNPLTTGKYIQNTIGVKNYSVSVSPQTTAVIPSIVTAPSGNSPQFVMTPPLTKIIPGQKMVIPVQTTLLSSWGGIKEITIKPKVNTSSTGVAPNDWLVAESSSTIPSTVGTTGITQTNINLFVDVKSKFEEDGVGFDWSQASNHGTKPVIKVRVAKSTSLTSDSNGCPVLTGYSFDTSSSTWKQQAITLSNPVSIDANTCELDLTVDHFSRFALSSSPKSTPSTPSTPSTSGSSAGGGGGGGGGGAGGTTGTGFGGKLVQPVIIYEITYDTCEQNAARIIVGSYGSDAPPPSVKIRTPLKEVYSATLAQDQPYTEANHVLPISRYVYEATLDPKLNFFIVTAEDISGRAAVTATYTVNIGEDCRKTIIVNSMTDLEKESTVGPTPEAGRPNIFDIKFQVDGNKPLKATTINQFVKQDSQFTVSAIIDSQSGINRAELRVNIPGGNFSNYAAVKMNSQPLQNITNAYVVSAELPTSFLQAPAIVYWVHVINNEGGAQDSERYLMGVKPTYKLDARMELDSTPSKAQGTMYRPTAYVYNQAEKPFFGSVSLFVNNTMVYTSPEQVFNKGQSAVNLEWRIPEVGVETQYSAYAQLNMYDKTINTTATAFNTFQGTQTFSVFEPIKVASVLDNEQMIARAGLLYSSNADPSLHYVVIAPDGTCVIGKSESCLVRDSTVGHRGNTISVELGDQIYRVRYSGQDNPLERFSITSIDPISGTWSVMLESDNGVIPEAHAIEDVHLKVKYRATYEKLVTVSSE